MADLLHDRALTLEEAFFKKHDAELLAHQRRLEKVKQTRESLAEVSGIKNAKVLDKLVELDISPKVLASMAIVPLVEVAWADGTLDAKERGAVLGGAHESGIAKGSVDYELLEHWLSHPPEARLLEAWIHYINGVCEIMNEQEREAFKKALIGRARQVAEASGGILGVALKTSPQEQAVLRKMENAFA
ncbi:MAG: hypothetical protein WCO69_06835 [Candidatus Omnitrophota bacterium]